MCRGKYRVRFGTEYEMSKARQFYEQGRRAEQEGRFKEALRFYKEAAREDSNFRPAFNNLGVIYARSGHPETAIGFFRRALELGEDDIVCFNLGSELYRLERYRESEPFLKRSLRLNNRLLKGHILIAFVYDRLGERDKAEIYFQNALKLDPENRPAALGFIVSLAAGERYEDALAAAENFLAKRPGDDGLKKLRAGLLLKLDRGEESLREFTELASTSKKFTSFTDHLENARSDAESEYSRVFAGMDDKIKKRRARLARRIQKRKELLKGGDEPNEQTEKERKQDLQDMVDLSFLHLFNGDQEKALKYLFQARKLKNL